MPEMTNEQKMAFIRDMAALIFTVPVTEPRTLYKAMKNALTNPQWSQWVVGAQVPGRTFRDSSTGLATLRGFDVSLDLGRFNADGTMKYLHLRFIEQNPNKRDGYGNLKENAILARQGHQIVWVIDNGVGGGFLGKVQNGKWIKNRPRVYNRTNQAPTGNFNDPAPNYDNQTPMADLPDVSGQNLDEALTIMTFGEGDKKCTWEILG